MSTKGKSPDFERLPGLGKPERYIQPSLLMGLYLNPSYGYELIRNLPEFGFLEGQAPPGMIYRHLRQMEEYGWVHSDWETEGAGPAKRVYRITSEGMEILALWVDYMDRRAQNLNAFVERYQKAKRKNG